MSNYCVSEQKSVRWQQFPTGGKSVPGRYPLVQQLRRIVRALSPRRSRRSHVLHLHSLSEHFRRDIGLTNHVEQPPSLPGWRNW